MKRMAHMDDLFGSMVFNDAVMQAAPAQRHLQGAQKDH